MDPNKIKLSEDPRIEDYNSLSQDNQEDEDDYLGDEKIKKPKGKKLRKFKVKAIS